MPKSKHGGFMYRELNVLVYVYVYVWPLNEQRPGNHRDKYADDPEASVDRNNS